MGAAQVKSVPVVSPVAPPVATPVASPVAPPLQSFRQLEPKASEPLRPEKKESKPVAFVCEDDVRAAMLSHARIVVGKKTIITPSARDLAEANGIFVVE